MKVRILSGNEKGRELEMPEAEAQNAIVTGFAEAVEAPAEPIAKKAKAKPHKPRGSHRDAKGKARGR